MNGYLKLFAAVILTVILTVSLTACGIFKREEETTAPAPDYSEFAEAETEDYVYFDHTAGYEEEMTAPETSAAKELLNKAPAATESEEETTPKQAATVSETVRTEAETTTVKPAEATAPATTRPVETTASATTAKPAETTAKESSGNIGVSEPKMKISFSTTDIDGSPVSSSDYSGAKVIMINYWEPWCGPCVSEIPALTSLYNEYSDKGLVILGVFSESNLEDAREIVKNNSVSYPVLISNGSIKPIKVSAIPTTVFTDGAGNVISPEPYVGSRNYSAWKAIIDTYLAEAD